MINDKLKVTIMQPVNTEQSLCIKEVSGKTVFVEGLYEYGQELTVEIIEEHNNSIVCKEVTTKNTVNKSNPYDIAD